MSVCCSLLFTLVPFGKSKLVITSNSDWLLNKWMNECLKQTQLSGLLPICQKPRPTCSTRLSHVDQCNQPISSQLWCIDLQPWLVQRKKLKYEFIIVCLQLSCILCLRLSDNVTVNVVCMALTGNWKWSACWVCNDSSCSCCVHILHSVGHCNGLWNCFFFFTYCTLYRQSHGLLVRIILCCVAW